MKDRLTIFLLIMIVLASCSKSAILVDVHGGDSSQVVYIEDDDSILPYNQSDGWNRLKYSDGYLYFINGYCDYINFPAGISLYRMNVRNGNLSSVCPNPICKHNTPECPFYGLAGSFNIYAHKVLFNSMYIRSLEKPNANGETIESGGAYKTYDLESGKLTERNAIDPYNYTEYTKQLFLGEDCYYYDYIYNGSIDNWVFSINKWNLPTNKVYSLCGEENVMTDYSTASLSTRILFSLDDMLYFTDGKTLYRTDSEYRSHEIVAEGIFNGNVMTDGEYIYYSVKLPVNHSSREVCTIYRMKFDGTDQMDLNIQTEDDRWNLTTRYIYYREYEERKIGVKRSKGVKGEEDELILYGGNIVRCGHDGTEKIAVFECKGDFKNYLTYDECVEGRYVYCLFDWWEDPNKDNVFDDSDYHESWNHLDYRIMRIDTETGDVLIINMN